MSNDTTISIYRIVCFATGMVYVGQTNNIKFRKRKHFGDLKSNKHQNRYLQFAYNKYGLSSFFFEVIETGIAASKADERERHWIAYYDSQQNGFNMTSGGYSGNGEAVAKPCEWNGIQYKSISEAARVVGINPEAMLYRLTRGYTCDSDMPRANAHAQRVIWEGIEYPSVSAAARALNMSKQGMDRRIKNGYQCETDIPRTNKGNTDIGIPFTWNGVEYPTISAAARANNISQKGMWKRRQSGYTCDEDIHGVRKVKLFGTALNTKPSTPLPVRTMLK